MIDLVSTKLEMVRSAPQTRTRAEDFYREHVEVKKENYLVGYNLNPSWPFVIGFA